MILLDLPTLDGFADLKEIDVIKLVMWWSHQHDGKEWVQGEDIRGCYGRMHRALPAGGFTAYLKSLAERKPPHVIKSRYGHKLEHRTFQALAEKYGTREATIKVEKLLTDLPAKLVSPDERSYLEEALTCFRTRAFRAAVVMTWNLTYDHLCYWILSDATRVATFNTQMAKTYAKKNYPPIANRDSFEDPKEFEVLQIAASAGLINGGMHMILKEKLDRRNKAAHPTGTAIPQPTAEDVIADLIENVVLKLR
jgi:hypothetical protein